MVNTLFCHCSNKLNVIQGARLTAYNRKIGELLESADPRSLVQGIRSLLKSCENMPSRDIVLTKKDIMEMQLLLQQHVALCQVFCAHSYFKFKEQRNIKK